MLVLPLCLDVSWGVCRMWGKVQFQLQAKTQIDRQENHMTSTSKPYIVAVFVAALQVDLPIYKKA